MLFALGAVAGSITALKLTSIWSLRKAKAGRPVLVLVALLLLPIAYSWGSDAFGWPTPGSLARSSGLLRGPVDVALLLGTAAATAAVTTAVLVASGVTRRLERWSREPE